MKALITPHGDLELASDQDSGNGDMRAHYPSWGFGTIQRNPVLNYAIYLITPHGDLELGADDVWNGGYQVSLPLMGIWNAAMSARLIPPPRRPHYPSWGFGTGKTAFAAMPVFRSLPLMGIWNRFSLRASSNSATGSLPLMGIWNSLGKAAQAANVALLITPHGDLELASSFPSIRAICSLITPHGDLEHVGPSCGSGRSRTLITPHGDLEPDQMRVVERLRAVSLPLMGIWNTPSSTAPPPDASSPHYPSWGFGTLRVQFERNLKCSTHYPSWGFGTRLLPDGSRVAIGELITPHGDLEPGRLRSGRRLIHRAHYPSWGFGTTTPICTSCKLSSSSLPLMGIWNPAIP